MVEQFCVLRLCQLAGRQVASMPPQNFKALVIRVAQHIASAAILLHRLTHHVDAVTCQAVYTAVSVLQRVAIKSLQAQVWQSSASSD